MFVKRSIWFVAVMSLVATFFSPIEAQAVTCAPSTTIDGGYKYLLFTSSTACDWTIPTGVRSIDYLAVGGGGGGASRHGGGGGAGGILSATNVSVTWGVVLSITVGAGGSGGGSGAAASGTNGNNSVISGGSLGTITALKGGGGGTATLSGNGVIGSGGGATGTGAIGYGTSGQGGNGGAGNGSNGCAGTSSKWCGGGGGGANGNGSASSSAGAGKGSDGITTFINATVATSLSIGENVSGQVYFAGGGGGGSDVGGVAGGGGKGGGSAGSVGTSNASAAASLTGGGGGGGGYDNAGGQGAGGAGGSGVVVIRYINDVNAPTFSSSATQNAAENIATSTNAVTITVSESASITLTGGVDIGDFTIVRIDNTSAALRFVTSPNFESPQDNDANGSFLVVITATDEYTNASTQNLTVNLMNVNEAPVITTNSGASTWSGNKAENTSLVFDFDATDVDAGTTLSWSLSGTDAGDFTVDASTGVLSFASGPDYELKLDQDLNNIYLVTVTVSDGALSASQSLTITVTNLNEGITPDSPNLSATPYKGVSVTITIKTYTPGKVRFLVGGKRIPNCLNVSTTGNYPDASASCSWKPASAARLTLSGSFTPTDNTFTSSSISPLNIWVTKRTGARS